MKNNLAPIVLFAHSRVCHVKSVVAALQKNIESKDSTLVVYCDGSKNLEEIEKTAEVREYLRSVQGFKSIEIIEREENYGLAKSITSGLDEQFLKYDKLIILEDDILVSENFLKYMNHALSQYEHEPTVWHVSGWNYPVLKTANNYAFFWPVMECWGWATWRDRWQHFDKNLDQIELYFDSEKVYKFNLEGSIAYYDQILGNLTGDLNTWAVFWYATIFQNQGLCLSPAQTLVKNIGLDGSGEHSGFLIYPKTIFGGPVLEFPEAINSSDEMIERIKSYHFNQRKTYYKILNLIYLFRKKIKRIFY